MAKANEPARHLPLPRCTLSNLSASELLSLGCLWLPRHRWSLTYRRTCRCEADAPLSSGLKNKHDIQLPRRWSLCLCQKTRGHYCNHRMSTVCRIHLIWGKSHLRRGLERRCVFALRCVWAPEGRDTEQTWQPCWRAEPRIKDADKVVSSGVRKTQ